MRRFPLRRHDAANEQDRPVGRIVQRRREPRGDIGLEIGPHGVAHAPDQRDPLRAKRDNAADQARRWRAPQRSRSPAQSDHGSPHARTRAARRRRNLPVSPGAPNSSSPPDRRRIRPGCRQSARSPAPGRHMARIAERIASRPICEPDPSSPSAKPRPPMMVSWP